MTGFSSTIGNIAVGITEVSNSINVVCHIKRYWYSVSFSKTTLCKLSWTDFNGNTKNMFHR